MARIPNAELERLKREVAVERLAEARGVRLERHGADLIGLCPFHDDHEPSLVITPAKNLWHCLGACQAGGSVVDWVMKAEGVSFRHAAELLRNDLPPEGLTKGPPPKLSSVPKLPGLLDASADDQVLLGRVVAYYHATLKESPEALAYLASRGLQHAEAVDRFQLGFANRTLAYRLPAKNRKEGAAIRERLQALGVIRASGHEHLNGSLVVPVFDAEGRVAELYGRKITANLRAGTPLHLYLPGPHRGVWNLDALQASREIILCESLLDALTFWCAGYRNVTAIYGTEGMIPDHWRAFERYGTERVLLAFDRDEAGERAAAKVAKELARRGIEAWRIQFPKGMDANKYALKVQPATRSLELLIRNAVWLGEGEPAPAPTTQAAASRATKEEKPSPPEIVADAPTESASEPAAEEEPAPSLAAEPVCAEPEPPAVTPAPAPPPEPPPMEARGEEIGIPIGDRRWRVRGIAKNTSFDALRVNVLVAREGHGFHVDTLDLYSARHRKAFLAEAAAELGLEERVVKRDLGQVLLRLEALQEETLQQALAPKEKAVEIGDAEREAALDLLRDPKLLDRILADFTRCGVVGEETNKLVGYLAAVSRKLEEPLAVVLQSTSAAGKSALMEAVLAFMPEEERVQYSAMTGQSLFYMGETDLRHKILAIVEEEGAERASYALKLLQSEGQLTIASTGKDPSTGRLITHEYRVEGPVMIFLTTTAIEIDEELLNRCLVLTVNEDREQTRAIHKLQRERQTLEGLLLRQDRDQVLAVHRNAQRLLRPLLVANPYARRLTFLDHQTRTRRDHMKYLTLIRAIALLHQYQRPVKTTDHDGRSVRYIEVTKADVALANDLAHEVLGRSLDELPPQTRRLLTLLDGFVSERATAQGLDRCDVRFTRREVREATGWTDFPVRMHLEKLVELEYLLVHRGGPGQRFVYELLWDGQGEAGDRFLAGLLDAEALEAHAYDSNCEATVSPPRAPLEAPVSIVSSGASTRPNGGTSETVRPGHLPGARRISVVLSFFSCPPLMPRRGQRQPKTPIGDPGDPHGLGVWIARFLDWLRAHNYSDATVHGREAYLALFCAWCEERGITRPSEVTKPLLERYQRHLFHYRKENGKPLSFRAQHARLVPLRVFFKWLTRQNVILYNPASELELPRVEKRLPKHVLTVSEAEAVLAQPDLADPLGLRDRAILETLYSTGIRRMEVAGLALTDLDSERGTLMVRQGKGKKDRMIPIGERALAWIERYLGEARPELVVPPDDGTLFLTSDGEPITPNRLTKLVREYVDAADLGKHGACHLFRHTMATLMLENGADIRFIQQMLGHAELSTTQVYTQVSVRQLKEIHTATHPSAKIRRAKPVRDDLHAAAVLTADLEAERDAEE